MEANSNEWVKWCLQAAFLIIAWYIKSDLKEIKEDGKANRLMNEATAKENALTAAAAKEHKTLCEERHKRDPEVVQWLNRLDQDIQHIRLRKEDH